MTLRDRTTILAISTPPGTSGIGVLRLSGPDSFALVAERFVPGLDYPADNLRDRHFKFRHAHAHTGWILANDARPLDQVVVLARRAPRTYTGEDMVEIHTHGNPALMQELLELLAQKAALAEPGEFTRRALLNDKLDLAQAEAVHRLVESQSRWGRELALKALGGHTSQLIQELRAQLIDLLARLEVEFDFSHEEVDELTAEELLPLLEQPLHRLERWLATWRGGHLAHGAQIVLTGAPNAGKSTLLNALLAEERVLVDDQPGTTRDAISSALQLGPLHITLWDTAGLRPDGERVERAGMEQTRKRLQDADLILALHPVDKGPWPDMDFAFDVPVLPLGTMSDRMVHALPIRTTQWGPEVPLSAFCEGDLERLKARMLQLLLHDLDRQQELVIHEERHRALLLSSRDALLRARQLLLTGSDRVLLATELRDSIDELGQIYGGFDVEELLDNIFAKFCIGK